MALSTLCYLFKDDDVLMLHRIKKEHDINAGKWIGVGGKFLPNEAPEACLKREVREETGLDLLDFTYHGIITFSYDDLEADYLHLFSSSDFSGQLVSSCDEGDLAWIPREQVPDLSLWPGDRLFLRLLFAGHEGAFTLSLSYQSDRLTGASLNGRPLDLSKEVNV